jgi:hypothetical protein
VNAIAREIRVKICKWRRLTDSKIVRFAALIDGCLLTINAHCDERGADLGNYKFLKLSNFSSSFDAHFCFFGGFFLTFRTESFHIKFLAVCWFVRDRTLIFYRFNCRCKLVLSLFICRQSVSISLHCRRFTCFASTASLPHVLLPIRNFSQIVK